MDAVPLVPGDYWDILKRRKKSFIFSFLIVMIIISAVALLLPSVYQSTSTILIEDQRIPSDFVMTTVSSYAEQRLESIKQRIITFSQLTDIIKKFGLYPKLVEKLTPEEVVDKMRSDIKIETINAEMYDRRTGRPTAVTTAFTLSYEGKNPRSVLRVTDTLTSLFLEENLKVRQRQISETSEFLSGEAKRIKAELEMVEAKLSAFKEQHMNELPELLQVNMQSLSAIERTIERLNNELRGMREREGYLQTQLSSTPPSAESQRSMLRDEATLNELKVQLAGLQKRYSNEYPDVKTLKAQIAQIEKQLQAKPRKYGNLKERPDNPAFITLRSQLASVQADIKSVKNQLRGFNSKADLYRQRIEATPKVEESYRYIVMKRDSLTNKFNDLVAKDQEAKVAQELEKEQKGERFVLIEPARLPEKPIKPNRTAILLVGFILAIGAAAGFAALMEFSDKSVKTTEDLTALTALPVLAAIPVIVTRREVVSKRWRRFGVLFGFLIFAVAGVAVFHYYVMDLDVFWARIVRRIAVL